LVWFHDVVCTTTFCIKNTTSLIQYSTTSSYPIDTRSSAKDMQEAEDIVRAKKCILIFFTFWALEVAIYSI